MHHPAIARAIASASSAMPRLLASTVGGARRDCAPPPHGRPRCGAPCRARRRRAPRPRAARRVAEGGRRSHGGVVAGGHRVVGVNELELEASGACGAGEPERGSCPGAPRVIGARTGRATGSARRSPPDRRRICLWGSLAKASQRRPGPPAVGGPPGSDPRTSEPRGGTSRCSTITRTSAPASRAAIAWRCAHTPSTGSSPARVELGDDDDLHGAPHAAGAAAAAGAVRPAGMGWMALTSAGG